MRKILRKHRCFSLLGKKDMVPLYLQQVRAYTERYPSAQGNLASAYEDLYPTIGGAGYNGCVASFYLKETYGPGTKDAANTALHPAMKGVYMRFYTQARGAGYHHALRPNLAHRAERVQRPRCQRQRPLHLHQPHRLLRPRARRGRRHEIVVPLFGGCRRSGRISEPAEDRREDRGVIQLSCGTQGPT